MSIVKMKFVSACSDKEHLDRMLLCGIRSKMLHPELAVNIVTEENGGKLMSAENPYAGYLQTFKNIAHSVGCTLEPKEIPSQEYTTDEIEAYIQELNTEFGLDTNSERETLSQEDEKALDELSVCGFEEIYACRYLNFKFGRLPVESFKKLSLYRDDLFVHHRLYQNAQYVWMVYVTSDSYTAKADKIFNSLFFEPIRIPSFDLRQRVQACHIKMQDIYSYCRMRTNLFALYPYVSILGEKNILSGFVKESDLEVYQAEFKDLPVDFRIHDPSEVPQCTCPTLLNNNWFAKPFELFIEMYSLPNYSDFDPTFFLSITYCILFGIMFGDMGQGIVLMILGFLLEKKGKLFGVIARAGITSTIFGFLFGSLFGNEHILSPLHQSVFGVREKLFEVMDNSNTMLLLIGAILVGAVMILCSMTLNIWNNARHKKWGEVLFSQNGIAGLVFYSFILAAIGFKAQGENLLKPMFLVPFAGIPFICFIMKEPFSRKLAGKSMKPHEGWGGYITESVFEAIEILLSFVTNSMSYLRVGGFVLSHAGMMLVVMTLVEMTGHAGIAVMIIGNIFVMVLEGLIVGIQTLRLEYYEMFSRYYTGGGIQFQAYTAIDAE